MICKMITSWSCHILCDDSKLHYGKHVQQHARFVSGNRDVVGFGVNGDPIYEDLPEYPCPAVRFRENSSEIMALREKEKGDWHKLTLEEKKARK